LDNHLVQQFRPIFYPRGIAVVGVSRDVTKLANGWARALRGSGFAGQVYPVNPKEALIEGFRVFPSVSAVPGPVDLAIVCVPRAAAMGVIEDCAARGVKAAHFFTGGFRETGKREDRAMEDELVARALKAGIRIIGPNCMGIYNPEAMIPWGPSDLMGKPGSVGFISQSGGHAVKMAEIGANIGIQYSKMVSYGNGADLEASDFIEYLAADPKTQYIGAYLEGSRDGRRLFQVLKQASAVKPVVLWKGGMSMQGAETASSHTGSMAASADVWTAALRQSGVVHVSDIEELADTLLLFQHVGELRGNRLAVVCGLTDGGGGESVLSADACARYGVEVPRFSSAVREKMGSIFGEIGSVLRNPLDVSQGGGDTSKLKQAMDLIMGDPHMDAVVVYENVEILVRFLSKELMDQMNALFIELCNRGGKPVISVLPPGGNDHAWFAVRQTLLRGGIPVFPSMDRAARAIANVRRYSARSERGNGIWAGSSLRILP